MDKATSEEVNWQSTKQPGLSASVLFGASGTNKNGLAEQWPRWQQHTDAQILQQPRHQELAVAWVPLGASFTGHVTNKNDCSSQPKFGYMGYRTGCLEFLLKTLWNCKIFLPFSLIRGPYSTSSYFKKEILNWKHLITCIFFLNDVPSLLKVKAEPL